MIQKTFDKDYFERGPYGKQDIHIIWRNYKILLDNAKVVGFLPSNLKHILDFGCAYGVGTMLLSKKFPEAHVVGVDISDYAINKARVYYRRENIEYHCLDLCCPEHLNFLRRQYGTFDLIFTRDTLEHIALNKQEEVIFALANLLKEGGTLIAQTPNKLNPLLNRDKTHIGLRSAKSWEELFSKVFKKVKVFEKQYVPLIWRFKRDNWLFEFPFPRFGSNIYIFCREKKNTN
jgi:2-polyprenyl-3-methyl-5-hydroxy-6-metoxy-1,4-benzoquinol methylase